MKTLFFICIALYVVGAVLGTLSVWYGHKQDFYATRRSHTLCTLAGFVFLGTVTFGMIYGMMITYHLWQ